MSRKILGVVALVLVSVAACASQPQDVSLVQLIANPMQYQGKTVRVVGFLHLEFEGNGLYLHKEDFEHSLYRNGIWIDATGPHFNIASSNNNKYVIVVGIFDANDQGHMGLWSGAIKQIERVDLWHSK